MHSGVDHPRRPAVGAAAAPGLPDLGQHPVRDDDRAAALARRRPLVRYSHRLLDASLPLYALPFCGLPVVSVADRSGLHPLTAEAFAGEVGPQHRLDADKRTWQVSVDLPIEAVSLAEAVREFWRTVARPGHGRAARVRVADG